MFDFVPQKQLPMEEMTAIRLKIHQLVFAPYSGQVPPILFHYTDAAGFKGIVESGVLRATHVSFMNDASEYLHAVELFFEHVKLAQTLVTDPLQQKVLTEMEKAIEGTRQEHAAPYFVACFSAEENSLNQWRAYGRGEGGFSIGFDGPTLATRARNDGWSLLAPAIYDRDLQAGLLRVFVGWVLNEYPRVAKNHAGAEQDEHRSLWIHTLLWMLTSVAPIMKNPAFVEEKEWRLVHLIQNKAQVRFVPKPTGLVPFVELKLGDPQTGEPGNVALLGRPLPDRLPIKVLWSGPGRAAETSLLAGRTLLEQFGYDGVTLQSSKIPFRVG